MNSITYSFLLTSLAGLSTLLGLIVIFIKKRENILISSLSFASGVMLCVSIIDLIPESYNLMNDYFYMLPSILFVIIFIMIGITLSTYIDKKMPQENTKLYRVGVISMIAIILHNIPEGILTYLTSQTNTQLGIKMTIAIALHNIPEGISIGVPIYYSTKSFKKAFTYTLISGLSEPFGAILAYLFLSKYVNNFTMSLLLAIIAGIMIQISLIELLPSSLSYKKKKKTYVYLILGIIFMSISHLLLN